MTELLNFPKEKKTDDGEIFNNLKKKEGIVFRTQTKGYANKRDKQGRLLAADSGLAMCEPGFIHRGSLIVHIYESEKPKDTINGSQFEAMFKSLCLVTKEVRWPQVRAAVQQLEAKVKAAFDKK